MEEREPIFDIGRYWQIIQRRRYLFLAAAVVFISLAIAASYALPKVYEASSTVSIEKNYLNMLMRDIAVSPSTEDRVQALSIEMTRRSMLRRVLEGLGVSLDNKPEADAERFIGHVRKKTQIQFDASGSNRRDMDLFTVTYRDRDPRFARDFVNALVRNYVEENVSRTHAAAVGANRFLYDQMELYKEKIDRVEAALERKGMQPGAHSAKRLSTLEKKYAELKATYTEQHPEMVRLKAEIDELRQQMANRRESAKDGTQAAGETRQPTGSGGKSIADLERDRDAYRKVYESLIASIGRSEVSAQVEAQATAATFHVLEPAILPMEPVSKARWKIILMGILAGLAAAAGTAIARDTLDRTIKSVDALRGLGLPVIGIIPRISTVETQAAAKRKDKLAYGLAGLYLFGVGIIFFRELLR